MAVDFCSAGHLEYVFLDYENDRSILEDHKHFYSQDTVPIILENNLNSGLVNKIGGYSDLLRVIENKVGKDDKTEKKKPKSKRKSAREK